MIGVNVAALTMLTRFFLPEMARLGFGRIVNVASVAAFLPGPGMAEYFATKAYVLYFSEAIRHELRGSGVNVTTLCPGPTASRFWERAGLAGFRSPMGLSTADDVVMFGYQAMMKGKRVAVYGFQNKLMAMIGRLVPLRIATAAAGRFTS